MSTSVFIAIEGSTIFNDCNWLIEVVKSIEVPSKNVNESMLDLNRLYLIKSSPVEVSLFLITLKPRGVWTPLCKTTIIYFEAMQLDNCVLFSFCTTLPQPSSHFKVTNSLWF